MIGVLAGHAILIFKAVTTAHKWHTSGTQELQFIVQFFFFFFFFLTACLRGVPTGDVFCHSDELHRREGPSSLHLL